MPVDKSCIPVNRMSVGGAEWDIGGNLNINSGGALLAESGALINFAAASSIKLGAGMSTVFGGSPASGNFSSFTNEGNLYRHIGNPIAGNGADATDDILDGFSLLNGAFDVAGRGLCFTAQGKFAANGNNKRVKLFINPAISGGVTSGGVYIGGVVTSGTALLDSGVLTDNATGWSLILNFFKYGAAGSNTQYSQGSVLHGTTHGGITAPVFTTATEANGLTFIVTGSSGSSAANDVVLNFFEANAMN